MRHIGHDNHMGRLLDAVTDAPILAMTRGVLASVFVVKRMTDTMRVVKERPDYELRGRRRDLLGKSRELALSARAHVEIPAIASSRHAAPVLRKR